MRESCRVCLSSASNSMLSLFDSKDNETIVQMMEFLSGIEILLENSEMHPQNICSECFDEISSGVSIKRRVIEAEELLKTTIKDEEHNKPEIPSEEVPDFTFEDCTENKSTIVMTPKTEQTSCGEENPDSSYEEGEENKSTIAVALKMESTSSEIKIETVRTLSKKKLKKQIPENTEQKKNKIPNQMDYKCFLCDKVFDKIISKNHHVRTDHKSERVCRICKDKCKTAFSLERHVKFHFRDYEFMCEICSKRFIYNNRLVSHMKMHNSQAAKVTCDICGLSTKFKHNMNRHMKSVHMKLKRFQCDRCPENRYTTQEGLKSHQYKYHDVEPPIRCPDCLDGFTFDSELRAHKKKGHCSNNIHASSIKKKKFESLEVIGGEHICKICNEKFPTKSKWSMHNYLKHKFSNKCEKCNIVFKNYTSMIRHESVKHQGLKPFKCEFCPKTFGQKCSLISHRNTHTGEKTFSCAFCPYKSGDHGTISKHRKKMHPNMTKTS